MPNPKSKIQNPKLEYIRNVDRPGAGRATFLLILAAGAGLTSFFLWRYEPALAIVSDIAVPLAAALIVALAALGLGWCALAVAQRPSNESFEADLDEVFLIGIGVFGTLIGLLAWFSVAVIPAVTVVMAVCGVAFFWKTRARYQWPAAIRPEALLLVPPVLLGLIAAMAPAVAPDELIYKLAVPHAYELYGRMVDLPLNSHSYFVMAQ